MTAARDTRSLVEPDQPLFARLRAQPTARRILERALESGRVHHAYLFIGPDGVGKELAAFGLAQALLCEARGGDAATQGGLFGAAPAPATPQTAACGACRACMRAAPREDGRPVHPDLVVLERGLYTPQQLGRRTPETQDLSIDQVRTLVLARAAFPPHEGRAKVFIVRRAEEMSASAANALLKTLEEPGDRTHFILLSAQPDALLPTIRSRTLLVRFGPLPDEVVFDVLSARGVTEDRARTVARLARGSASVAISLADPDTSDAREAFVSRVLEAAASRDLRRVIAIGEDAKKDKGNLAGYLGALAAGVAERARDAAARGDARAEALALRGSHALAALEHLDGNGNPQLTMEAMLLRMSM